MFDNCLTNMLKLKGNKQNLTLQNMKEEYVTVREFLRNFRKFSGKKKPIIISKNGKPENVFIPYKEWEEKQKVKEISLLDIMKEYDLFENNGDPEASQKVDEICYGANNPYRNDNN